MFFSDAWFLLEVIFHNFLSYFALHKNQIQHGGHLTTRCHYNTYTYLDEHLLTVGR